MEREQASAAKAAGGHVETAAKESTPSLGMTSSGVGPKKKKVTPEERAAAMKFLEAAFEDAKQYHAMTEEEVEDEYRRAGKLHKYDPDKERQKRVARVAKVYPPPRFMARPQIEEFLTYLAKV